MIRSTSQVLDDHLRRRETGRLLDDLEQDYAEDVVLLCEHPPAIGRDAVRESAKRLHLQLPSGAFQYLHKHVEGEYAFLLWRGESEEHVIENGADSFVVRGGRIVMQSIYYTVHSRHRR